MNFRALYQATDCTTDAETAGLAVYYLTEYQGFESVRTDDLLDLLVNSGIWLKNFPAPDAYAAPRAHQVLDALDSASRRGWIRKNLKGDYFLETEGREYFEGKIQKPLPDESAPSGPFLNIDTTDEFYEDVVREVNLCFNVGSYNSTMVIYRKFLENILIDILRAKYGMENLSAFYIENESRFRGFSELISEFEERVNDFRPYSSRLQFGGAEELIKEVKRFRGVANPSAHSIDHSITKEKITEHQSDATQLAEDLLRLKKRIENEENT